MVIDLIAMGLGEGELGGCGEPFEILVECDGVPAALRITPGARPYSRGMVELVGTDGQPYRSESRER